MTTHQSAIEVLKNKSKHRKTEILPLANCLHLVSADEVFAPINVPSLIMLQWTVMPFGLRIF